MINRNGFGWKFVLFLRYVPNNNLLCTRFYNLVVKIDENEKAIILSVVKEEKTNDVLETLTEKFDKIKNGKGIAFTIPMQSIIGVSLYQFLSNNTAFIKEGK